MPESVTKNTTFLTGAYVWQKLLSFVYFVLVARFIGVENLGKYTFAISFATLFAVLLDLGFNSALIRESAKFKERAADYLSSILSVKIITAILVYALVAVAINLLGYPPLTKLLVYLAAIPMVFDQFANTFWGAFRGQQNLRYEALNIVINQVIILVVGLGVLFFKLPLPYLMLPFILASAFSMIFAGVSVRRVLAIKYRPMFDTALLKTILKIAVPFALIAIFSRVYGYIDSVMLSKMVGDKAVGWYSVAMKIPFALQFIPAALAASIFPAFSHHFMHDKEQLRATFERVVKFLLIIVVPMSVGIAVLARPIVLSFYGAEYLPAVLPLQILMAGLVFVFLNFPLGSLLNGCDRHVFNMYLVGAIMVANVAMNIFAIPRFSFVGAAAAFVVSHALLFVVSMIAAARIVPYGKARMLLTAGQTIISAGAMAMVILMLIDKVHFILLIIIGALVYAAMIFLVRGLTIGEIKYFVGGMSRKKSESEMV